MRTGTKQFSSQPEQKPPSPKESKNARHDDDPCVAPERLSLFKRFKQMYRDYWYVLIPVHVVTSIGWFGAFYYMCVSGVDVVAALESLNISEKLINPLRDSKAGYVALSYAMYKIATPLRYTVTLGGTTLSINYLRKWGYIKPIPPREKLKEMYDEKKENLMERKDAIIKETAEQLKEHKESFMRSYRRRPSRCHHRRRKRMPLPRIVRNQLLIADFCPQYVTRKTM
ncbi:uncharacterized protein C18orf19 homolog A isoform X2 [Bacillus rossius redtenbacheri]